MAGGLAGDDDALDEMVTHLRTTFELDAVSLLAPDASLDGGWRTESYAGEPTAQLAGRATAAWPWPAGPCWSTTDRR